MGIAGDLYELEKDKTTYLDSTKMINLNDTTYTGEKLYEFACSMYEKEYFVESINTAVTALSKTNKYPYKINTLLARAFYKLGAFLEVDYYADLDTLAMADTTLIENGYLKAKVASYYDIKMELPLAKEYYGLVTQKINKLFVNHKITNEDQKLYYEKYLYDAYNYFVEYNKKDTTTMNYYREKLKSLNYQGEDNLDIKESNDGNLNETKVKKIVSKYCFLLNEYTKNGEISVAKELQNLFANNKNIVFNDLNPKESYTEFRFYLRNIELKRGNGLEYIFPTDLQNVKIEKLGKDIDNVAYKASIVQINKQGKIEVKTTIDLLIDPVKEQILNTFNPDLLAIEETKLTDAVLTKSALNYFSSQDKDNGLKRLISIAKKGQTTAMVILAELYTEKLYDTLQGKFWYDKAVAKNDRVAMCKVSKIYDAGAKGIAQDKAKAVELLNKSIELNYLSAFLLLGVKYQVGDGVVKDLDKAISLYEKIIELGDKRSTEVTSAKFNLGLIYINESYKNYDYKKALEYVASCSGEGNIDCTTLFGFLLTEGLGTVGKNKSEGEQLLLWAAKRGNVNAMYFLGAYYKKDTKNSRLKAIKWLKAAANKGKKEAKALLNEISKDIDVTQSDEIIIPSIDTYTGIEWLEQSVKYFQQMQLDAAITTSEYAIQKGVDKKYVSVLLIGAYIGKDKLVEADQFINSLLATLNKEKISKKDTTEDNIDNVYYTLYGLGMRAVIYGYQDTKMELGISPKAYEAFLSFYQKYSNLVARMKQDEKKTTNKFVSLAYETCGTYYFLKKEDFKKAKYYFEQLLPLIIDSNPEYAEKIKNLIIKCNENLNNPPKTKKQNKP